MCLLKGCENKMKTDSVEQPGQLPIGVAENEGEPEETEERSISLDTESLIIAMERVTVLFDRSL